VEAVAVSRAAVIAGASTRAGQGREHNEDSYLVDLGAAVFLVADGMGGHAAGEVASELAVSGVHAWWTDAATRAHTAAYAATPAPEQRRALFHAVRDGMVRAHLRIAEAARRDESQHGMGTTLTGLLVAGGDAIFAHAGDSRAYLLREGSAVQLSEDHNIQTRLQAAGLESANPRWSGTLTCALGVGDVTRFATFAVPLVSGDRFVLCSDGVHAHVDEADLVATAHSTRTPAQGAAALVDLAVERGSTDDATALVVEITGAADASVAAAAARAREAAALATCALFEALSPPERLRALRIATPSALVAGDDLAPSVDGDRAAYILVDGEAALATGDRALPGTLIYAGALIEGTASPRDPATATTAGRVLLIRRRDFLELTEEEPDLGVKLYAALARLVAR
jgi:serine/threonine protein phosphatase PrpC